MPAAIMAILPLMNISSPDTEVTTSMLGETPALYISVRGFKHSAISG